jgi:hypothetical protein
MAETSQRAESARLSDAAVALLRRHYECEAGLPVDDTTREAYRELEAAGLVLLSRPFIGPRLYVLTKLGWKLEDVLARIDVNASSP